MDLDRGARRYRRIQRARQRRTKKGTAPSSSAVRRFDHPQLQQGQESPLQLGQSQWSFVINTSFTGTPADYPFSRVRSTAHRSRLAFTSLAFVQAAGGAPLGPK